MRVFIFSAMKEETESLLKDSRIYFFHVKNGIFDYYKSFYKGKEVIVSTSGIGRVASAVFLASLNDYFRINNNDILINVGAAGGLAPLHIGDVVTIDNAMYGDVDLRAFTNYRYGQMSNCPFAFKLDEKTTEAFKRVLGQMDNVDIQTNESFTEDYSKTKHILDKYYKDMNVLAFDMESAAYAQAAYMLGLRLAVLRYISDIVGSKGQADDYKKNNESLEKKSDAVLKEIIFKYLDL